MPLNKLSSLELQEFYKKLLSRGRVTRLESKNQPKGLSPKTVCNIHREAKKSGVFELYYLDLATGLRRGELLGLKWTDIDLEKGKPQVKRQVAWIEGEIMEAPLKTKNAYRTLPLAEDVTAILKQQRKKAGSSPWVIHSPNGGGPTSPDSVLCKLHGVLKRAGLPQVRFHDLRHPFATLALQNGVDITTARGCGDTTPPGSPWIPTPM